MDISYEAQRVCTFEPVFLVLFGKDSMSPCVCVCVCVCVIMCEICDVLSGNLIWL